MSEWRAGFPRTLTFTVGALDAGDLVYLDYYKPGATAVTAASASISDRTTGACSVTITPAAAEAGQWVFWPRVVTAAAAAKACGDPVVRQVYAPGAVV